MRIGIIAFSNIRYCPYIRPYTNILEKYGLKYDILYFDRNEEGIVTDEIIPIKWNNKKNKILNFISFSFQARKIIRSKSYDKLVILTTTPGVLLADCLWKKYKGKYVVDVRDYTFENNKLFRRIEKIIIENSAMNVISSPGFKNFLPVSKYYICHNTTYDFSNVNVTNKKEHSIITIGYVGSLAYANQCKKLIDLVKNDARYNFYFYGNETSGVTIQKMIESAQCERIKYFGAYEPDEKERIIKSVDILFNAYGNKSDKLIFAISNKFYDSLSYSIPVITSPNTEMSRLLGDFSFDIDENTDSLDKLYDWYISIDYAKVNDIISSIAKTICSDQDAFEEAVKREFLHIQ